MLYLEELIEATIDEYGEGLLGLDFITDTLGLSMEKIDLLFRKSVSEYGERRPMKKTEDFSSFSVDSEMGVGYIQMPEGTTSCRIARYGIMPTTMPRFYLQRFPEMNVEFDPVSLTCKVWPPIAPIKLTYTKKYVATNDVLIEKTITSKFKRKNYSITLPTTFADTTLLIQKAVVVGDEEQMLSMAPTGDLLEQEEVDGGLVRLVELEGTLGTGTYDYSSRTLNITTVDDSINPVVLSYYPKYSVVEDLDIGHYVLTKIFAVKLLGAIASLKSLASQDALHNIDLTQDQLYDRVQELKDEVREINRSTISFGDMSLM